MGASDPIRCRACGSEEGCTVLDLGRQPAADDFPLASDPGPERRHPLSLWWCAACGLAQLPDATGLRSPVPEEPLAIEPMASVVQASGAVDDLLWSGLIAPGTFREFPSPHGGSWGASLRRRGFARVVDGPADVVVDVYGLMHEPDQASALRARVDAMAEDGVLLLQFPTVAATLRHGEWNAVRHGHFAYHSVPAASRLLAAAGLEIMAGRSYPLYGGSVLLVASRAGRRTTSHDEAARLAALRQEELLAGVLDPGRLASLDAAVAADVARLRGWVTRQPGGAFLYGAGSRAVALLATAGLPAGSVRGIGDGSPAKQGRRMPGTSIPIVAPERLVSADPGEVLLLLPDLLPELRRALPTLAGRWVVYGATISSRGNGNTRRAPHSRT